MDPSDNLVKVEIALYTLCLILSLTDHLDNIETKDELTDEPSKFSSSKFNSSV